MGLSSDYPNVPNWEYKATGYEKGAMVKYQGNVFIADFWASEPGKDDPNHNGWRLYDELYDLVPHAPTESAKIIAYIPAWKKDSFNYVNDEIYRYITHGIIAFLTFDEVNLGKFQPQTFKDVNAIVEDVVTTAHRNGVKVSIALGGADDYGFLYLMNRIGSNPSDPLLDQVAQDVVSFVKSHNLDGVDLDLECWWGKPGEVDQGGRDKNAGPHPAGKALALFAQRLRQAMPDKLVSAAVFATSWYGNNYDPAMIEYLDWVGAMTYDLTGSWSQSPVGPHSALYKIRNQSDYAEEQYGSWPPARSGQGTSDPMVDNPILSVEDSLWYWSNRFFTNWQGSGQNIPRNKIAAGVPLYGYDFAQRKPSPQTGYVTIPYNDNLIQSSLSGEAFSKANIKILGSSASGAYPYAHNIYLETPTTAVTKLNFLKGVGAQGVIIWELSNDIWEGGRSIVQALYRNSGNPDIKPPLPPVRKYVPALHLEGDGTVMGTSGIYQDVFQVGGNSGGKEFSFIGGEDGVILQKIGVWAEGWQIKAIRVWLTNGNSQTFGVPSGIYKEHSFDLDEQFTELSLWGNGAGTRAGWIKFTTNKGKTFDHGMTEWGRKQEYPIDIGSGICCGVVGRAGADVDYLGFVFLRPIKTSRMIGVKYPTLDLSKKADTEKTVRLLDYDNSSSVEQVYLSPAASTEETKEFSWTVTTALEIAAKVTVSAEIPDLAKVGAEFGWKLTVTGSYGYKNTTKITVTDPSQTFKVPPHTHLGGTITYYKGKLNDLLYEAKVELELINGVKLSYPVKGSYHGVSFSKAAIAPTYTPVSS